MKKQKATEHLSKAIVKNAFWNFLFNIISRLGGLIFTVIAARLLLPELFGIYSLALGTILLLLGLIEYGINTTTIKYVSEALGKNQETKARSYFRFCLSIKAAVAGFFAILLFLFAKPVSNYIFHKPLLILPFQIGAIYLFATAILTSFLYLAYSLKKIKYVAIEESIFQVARIVLVFLFLYFFKYKTGSVFVALAISAFLGLVFLFFIIRKKYNFLLKGDTAKIDKKSILKFLFFTAIAGISSSFFVHIDIVMLGALLPQAEIVGFYEAALTVVTGIAALITFSQVSFPVFTQLKGKKLKNAFSKFFRYSAILSFPCAFGLPFVAKPFINAFFGAEYTQSMIPLYLLSFLIIEIATGIFFTVIVIAKEKPQYIAKIMFISALLNIILCYLLIKGFAIIKPQYGMMGAALATLFSRYFYFFSLAILSKREFGIKPDISSIYKTFFACAVMLIFLFVFNNFFVPSSVLSGFIEILSAALIYFAVMWIIKGITREDLELLRFYRKKTI